MKFIIFRVGSQEYAIRADQTREVMVLSELHPLPLACDFIDGIISVRGHSVAVVDFSKRLQLLNVGRSENEAPAMALSARNVIIVKAGGLILGLIVDAVKDLAEISDSQIVPINVVVGSHMASHLMAGIVDMGKRKIMVVDPDQILSEAEFKLLKSAGERTNGSNNP